MGSQTILQAMVRAHNEPSKAKTHNPYYVKLGTQDVVVEAQSGTRPPHLRHDLLDLRKTTPSPRPSRPFYRDHAALFSEKP